MKIKKIIAGMLAIAFVVCTSGVTAKAAPLNSVETAVLGTVPVKAESRIFSSSATCSTQMSVRGYVSVSGVYHYINFQTLEVGSRTAGSSEQYGTSVTFIAPASCRSVRVCGSHKVSCEVQSWGTKTGAAY